MRILPGPFLSGIVSLSEGARKFTGYESIGAEKNPREAGLEQCTPPFEKGELGGEQREGAVRWSRNSKQL